MNGDLKLCLSIYSNDKGNYQFRSETEIISNIPKIVSLVKSGAIRLGITDGVVSIKYKDEELLGKAYWDDIHLVLGDVFYGLKPLLKGEEVKSYFPMHSMWLNLKLNGDYVIYNLKSSAKRSEHTGKVDIVREIPKGLFVKEFVLFYLRSVRILATIGSDFRTYTDDNLGEDEIIGRNFEHVFQEWREYVPLEIFSTNEIKTIQKLMDMPLSEWVATCGC